MAANQLLLLPLQLSAWGHAGTATWYTVVAAGALCTISDLGLRTAGHADLLQHTSGGDTAAREAFRSNWLCIRVLGIAAWLGVNLVVGVTTQDIWPHLIVTASALDALIAVRTSYFDTLRRYQAAELIFLTGMSGRVVVAAGALIFVGAPPSVLAWIYLTSSILMLAAQGLLCHGAGALLRLLDWPAEPRLGALRTAGRTIAIPLSNWCQIHLPVIVTSAIAPANWVTVYVAVRALLGFARATIQQVSRVTSVEFVRLEEKHQRKAQDAVALATSASVLLCATVAMTLLLDHGRIFGLWIPQTDRSALSLICIAMGIALPAYGYQITYAVAVRKGSLEVASRSQYIFSLLALAAAAIGSVTRSAEAYLLLASACEIAVGCLLLTVAPTEVGSLSRSAARQSLFLVATAALAIAGAGAAAQFGSPEIFSAQDTRAAATTMAVAVSLLAAVAAVALWQNSDRLRAMARKYAA